MRTVERIKQHVQRIRRLKSTATYLLTHKLTLRRALTFSARHNLPWLAALVLAQLPKTLPLGTSAQPKECKLKILVLNFGKDEYFRDLEEIFREDQSFELVAWPHYALQAISKTLLHPSLSHDRYITDNPIIEATKVRYRNFLASTWRHYQARKRVHAAISANFGYCAQREMAFALEQQGTPFLVMQKENLNAATEERGRIWRDVYQHGRGKFGGRKILVYNEIERQLELAAGVVEPERVVTVGMPRLDRFHRWRRENAGQKSDQGKPLLLFFSFSQTDKIPSSINAGNWGAFCTKTHLAILNFARSNPQVEVAIKTKGTSDHDSQLMQVLNSTGSLLPCNIQLVSGGDAFDLITKSSIVVGFNTTGLIEALALGKTVIVPRFDEALDPTLRQLILDLGDAVDYADSPRQLEEMIAKQLAKPLVTPAELPPKVESMLEHWVGNRDGQAGLRAYAVIRREVTARSMGNQSDVAAENLAIYDGSRPPVSAPR
jgi:hypothetical protein